MASGYVLPDTTLSMICNLLRGIPFVSSGCRVHLFQNAVTVTDAVQTPAALVECDFEGYAPIVTNLPAWSAPVVNGHVAKITAPAPIVFTSAEVTATQNTFGYFVTDPSGALLWAESFAAPTTIGPGGTFKLTPSYRQKTCR